MEFSDHELLQKFLRSQSEDAFRGLVDCHLPMVLGTARRMLGNEQAAQEVAQNTFALLAQKAASLKPEQSLGGWLHRAARNESLHVQRAEGRRRKREETAAAMNAIEESATTPEWLDDLEEALEELAPDEHDVLVLRFLEDRKLRDVGTELGVGEDAARMRVNRALDRLRMIFEQRGINVSAGALIATLTAQATLALPAGLGAAIATTVFTNAAAATGAGTVVGWLTLKSAATVIGIIAAAGVGLFITQRESDSPEPVEAVQTVASTTVLPNEEPAVVSANPPAVQAPDVAATSAGSTGGGRASITGSEEPPTPEAQQLLEEARGLIDRRQYEDALERLNAAIELSPRFADAYLFRGIAFEGAEKLPESLASHRRAAELRPTYKQAWFEQSRIHDRLQQYDETIRTATKAIEIDPDFWQAWLGRGRAKYHLNLSRDALPDLDKAAELNPKFTDIYHYRALVYSRFYQFDQVLLNRRLAAETAPDDYEQQYRLANTLSNQGYLEEALRVSTRAIELSPASAGGWRVRAYVLKRLGRSEESISDFTELQRIEPQNPRTFWARGWLYFTQGRKDEALKDLNRAVQLGSGYGPIYRDRGRVLLNLGKSDLALADFQRAGELGRGRAGLSGAINYHDLWQWQGEAYVQQGNPVAAIAELTRRIEHLGESPGPAHVDHRSTNTSNDADEMTDDARATPAPDWSAEEVVATAETSAWRDRAYLWRGIAYQEAGQSTNALADLDLWLDRNDGTTQAHYYRGQAHVALEQWKSALEDFSRAVELNPKFAGGWEFRGSVRHQLGDFEKSLDDFMMVLKLDPKSDFAKRMARSSAEKLGRTPTEIDELLQPFELAVEPAVKPPATP